MYSETSNEKLLRPFQKQADELGCIASDDSLPVVLRKIAQRRRVTSVEFVPMLARAMLTTHPDGFRVFINAEETENCDELRHMYDSECPNALLPGKFRFSLAHELAHTLFYDLQTDQRPREIREFKASRGKTMRENLERYCNRIAGHILMPSPVMKNEILKLRDLQPESIVSLAERAGASVESLVTRLNDEDGALIHHNLRGCVAVLRSSPKGIFVKAVARPHHLNIAKEIRLIRAGEQWQLSDNDGRNLINGDARGRSRLLLTVETKRSSEKVEHEMDVLAYKTFEENILYVIHLVAVEAPT